MSNLLSAARYNAVRSFDEMAPSGNETHSFYTYSQHHQEDCVTACLRFLSDTYDQEAPSQGLTFAETLMVAANFGLYLLPIHDLDLVPPSCILLGLTADLRNHAFLIQFNKGDLTAIYDPAKGVVWKGTDIPNYDFVNLALVYKPSSLRDAD